MSKYQKVSDYVQEMFDGILETTAIPHWVEFELRANDKQKDIYSIRKMNDLVESLTDGLNFVIIINEEIFEQLEENYQKILITECLAGVTVSEQDAINYEKPNFATYRGVLEKFGHEEIITLKESIKSLYDAKKQREDEEKAAKKTKKKFKKSF